MTASAEVDCSDLFSHILRTALSSTEPGRIAQLDAQQGSLSKWRLVRCAPKPPQLWVDHLCSNRHRRQRQLSVAAGPGNQSTAADFLAKAAAFVCRLHAPDIARSAGVSTRTGSRGGPPRVQCGGRSRPSQPARGNTTVLALLAKSETSGPGSRGKGSCLVTWCRSVIVLGEGRADPGGDDTALGLAGVGQGVLPPEKWSSLRYGF